MAEFNLKSFRENELKITQAELAELIGVKQDTVSRMEKNPSQISVEMLVKIADKTGQTVDELIKYEKPELKPLEPEPTYEDVSVGREHIVKEIRGILKDSPEVKGSDYASEISVVSTCIESGLRKPVIGILGRSDSGKSTLINKLMGGNKLPTGWTPKTSINVFIKHIEDRPKYMEDEVWVFKKAKDEDWDHTRLQDEAYCRKWKLAGGTVDMLNSFGTHDGEGYRQHDIGAAVLFIDAPILKNADLLDIPGFTGAMERDTALAKTARGYIDAVVYLSQANSFLIAEDIEFLKFTFPLLGCVEGINSRLSPLANIYVLASQAHIINRGNKEKLNNLLDNGCSRFCKTITGTFWNGRSQAYEECTQGKKHTYTEKDLRARFFPYSIDIAELCQDFEEDLKQLTEILPDAIKKLVIKRAGDGCSITIKKIDADIKVNEGIIKDHESAKEALAAQQAAEYKRQAEIARKKKDVISAIEKARLASKANFEKEYSALINVDAIRRIIKQGGYKDEKEGKNLLLSYINARLQEEYSDVMRKELQPVEEKIKLFLDGFKSGGISVAKEFGVEFSFDAPAAFAAGLAGLGTAGALALASSAAGNLGGYILVAKGVGVLSSIGISVGGGAAATSAVSAIGGPVTLGIGLTVLIAAAAWKFFSSSWDERAAKDICSQMKQQNALGQYKENIDKFWQDYQESFEIAANSTVKEDKNYTEKQADKINNFNQKNIQEQINIAKKVKEFFVKIQTLLKNF